MRKIAGLLFRSFLQGLLIISPIVVTAYVIYIVFDRVDSLVPEVPRGLGFLGIVAVITVTGYLGTRLLIGRMLFHSFDYIMEHIPGIKYLYSSIKEVMDSFVGDKKRFNKPVWVRVRMEPEIWRIGFMTREHISGEDMGGKAAVYLPHAYAISGYVILADKNHIRPVKNMNPAEAMKFAVSGGVTNKDDDKRSAEISA